MGTRLFRTSRKALLGAFSILLTTSAAVDAQPTELFITEYIEGSSNNKAIEIPSAQWDGFATDTR
jgi:hypothetical protein